MRRPAPISVTAFDPEVQEAAQEAARRAGMPVDAWLQATMDGRESDQEPRRTRRRPDAVSEPFDADRAPPRRARRSPRDAEVESASLKGPAASPAADPVLDRLERRIDEMDRRLAERASAASRSGAAPVAKSPSEVEAASGRLEGMLRDFESRITAIGERIATPRALGRRGRPAEAEIRDAVAEIRQRQRDLDGSTAATPATREPAETPTAIADLHVETARLRDTLGGLASGRDVGVLETSVRALSAEVERAAPGDVGDISGPIGLLRLQVERLAEDVAANVHARVAADVDRLVTRIDRVVAGAQVPSYEPAALDGLFRELDGVRRQIDALAEPERVQAVAHDVARLTQQVAELARASDRDGGDIAQIRPLLEDIRRDVQAPRAALGDPAIESRLDSLGAKLDALKPARGPSRDVIQRIDSLSAKLDGLAAGHIPTKIEERLDDLGAALRSPGPVRELTAIHRALEAITARLDQLGDAGGVTPDMLDGLERQVMAVAHRLDAHERDPAVAGLERTIRDLAVEIAELRGTVPDVAAMERATRAAVSAALRDDPRLRSDGTAHEAGVTTGLADLKAAQSASERRIQDTLESVHGALARLVDRLVEVEAETAAPAPSKPSREERTVPHPSRPQGKPARSQGIPAAVPAAIPVRAPRPAAAPSLDELLEPGMHRPPAASPDASLSPDPLADAADVKASFIAAARRAAQAAAAEATRPSPASKLAVGAALKADKADTGAKGAETPRSELLAGLKRHLRIRRSLVIGLAAAVLALGALKVGSGFLDAAPEVRPAPRPTSSLSTVPAPVASPRPADAGTTAAIEPTPSAAPTVAPPEVPRAPATTGALAPTRAEPSLPKVSGMSAFDADLAAAPGSLNGLRQAALSGDAAAIYDLAVRAADGRGLARDPKLSARLLEKVAGIGIAPAEYRLGNVNEKGIGIPKDLVAARQLYGRAADKGNVRAMHNLAVLLAESGAETGKPDYAGAVTWFRKAADFGIRDSQYNLAVLLARGLGTQQDLVQAYGWFSAAAAQGDDDAGRKRDEVATKLAPKDLDAAKAQAAAWRPRTPDAAANDAPQSAATRAEAVAAKPLGTSLVGAPPPGAGRRVEAPAVGRGRV